MKESYQASGGEGKPCSHNGAPAGRRDMCSQPGQGCEPLQGCESHTAIRASGARGAGEAQRAQQLRAPPARLTFMEADRR